MPPLTDLIGQSAEAGLPLGNSCKQFPPPPRPLPAFPTSAAARLLALPRSKWAPNFSLLAPEHAPRVSAAGAPAEDAPFRAVRAARGGPSSGRRELAADQRRAEEEPASCLSRVSPEPWG